MPVASAAAYKQLEVQVTRVETRMRHKQHLSIVRDSAATVDLSSCADRLKTAGMRYQHLEKPSGSQTNSSEVAEAKACSSGRSGHAARDRRRLRHQLVRVLASSERSQLAE